MSKFLEAFGAHLREAGCNVFRVSEAVGDGEIETVTLAETNPCQNSYSITKAFTVTAVGLLFDRGLISPDEKLCELLPEHFDSKIDGRWRRATLDDAMRHRLGLPSGFLDIDTHNACDFGRDHLAYTFAVTPEREPGEARCYSDGAYYIVARAIEARAGMPMDKFLWENLLFPLGVREAAFSKCPLGHVIGATGLYIRSEDIVKLGSIYLHGGIWKGERMFSEEWVSRVLSREYELRPTCGGRAYGKGGMRGQMLLVIPSQNRVVAWHGCGSYNTKELSEWICDNF